MKRCIYCNQEKEENQFSEEHVLPQAIGGALHPSNPFKTGDVCRRCNNLCGLFVDSAFIRSWFTQANRSQHARERLNLSSETATPLIYMGEIPELAFDDQICEYWLGPTGDSIFHFHRPYPDDPDLPIIVGVQPTHAVSNTVEIDSGFAFLFVVASNPAWHPLILNSFINQFKDASLYLGNGPNPGCPFSQVPTEREEIHLMVREAVKCQIHARIGMTINNELRFLGKLALGIGHLFLAAEFAAGDDANQLRSLMWAKTYEQKERALVRGAGFLSESSKVLGRALSWKHGHIIGLLPCPAGLTLYARFYDSQTGIIRVTDDKAYWRDTIPEEGLFYAVAPSLRKFAGPISLPDFLAHTSGNTIDKRLGQLEAEVELLPPLPPIHFDEP